MIRKKRSSMVGVIGLGYVGLPLAARAAESGFQVYGFDIDKDKIRMLKEGKSYIEDVTSQKIRNIERKKKFFPTYDLADIGHCEIVILCVPTPLTENSEPDLSILKNAIESIAPFLNPDCLVINESTSYPGTLRDFIAPAIQIVNPQVTNFAVAPERIDPGSALWGVSNIPRVIGGLSKVALDRADNFYRKITKTVVKVSTPEVAELSKLIENSFRQINIAFVNDLARFSNKSGISLHEALDAASSKPFGFSRFYPGLGVGGHCIPIDPLYLQKSSLALGHELTLVSSAQNINETQPEFIASLIIKKWPNPDTKICVMGIAYKPKSTDLRHAPSLVLLERLKFHYKTVTWYDPFISNLDSSIHCTDFSQVDLIVYVHGDKDFVESVLNNYPCLSIFDVGGTIPETSRIMNPYNCNRHEGDAD